MSISKRKLKSGRYSYRVTVNRGIINGKRKNALATAASMEEARLLEARLKLQVANGTYKDKHEAQPVVTFRDLYEQWWPVYVETVEGSTAYKTRQLFANHLLPLYGDTTITDIKTGAIQSAVLQWRKNTVLAYRMRFVYLKKILAFAVKMDYIQKNPADNVELPRRVKSKVPEYWNEEQCARFLNCIDPVSDPEKYTIFRLLIDTGIRREELCALNVSDVDFNAGTLSINKAYATGIDGKEAIKSTKTETSERVIPLMPADLQLLRQWVAVVEAGKVVPFKNDRPLFPSPRFPNIRISINTPNQWLRTIIKKNKLTPVITLHGLRHSFITNALRSGNDPSVVQRLAGHASATFELDVYSGLDQTDARKGITKLAKYLNR